MNNKYYLSALEHYHPDGVLKNSLFESCLDTSDEWIVEHIGIHERRFLSDYSGRTPVFELGKRAVEKVKLSSPEKFQKIDYIISCGSMDDFNYPSMANLISEYYKVPVPCLHLKAACASFVYSVQVGKGLLASGAAKTILIVNSEPFTRQVDYGDRTSAVLFGDAAVACILSSTGGDFEVIEVNTGGRGIPIVSATRVSQSSHKTVLDFVRGNLPEGVPELNRRKNLEVKKFEQNGKDVKEFVINEIPKIIETAIAKQGLEKKQIDWYIFHQANLRLLETLCKTLNLKKEKHLYNLDKYGNTSSAGAPSVLSMSAHDKKFFTDDLILITTFGAGMCWGTLTLKKI
jgi:3-oxoacyl-[acyl-carrier-protein] synthase-3